MGCRLCAWVAGCAHGLQARIMYVHWKKQKAAQGRCGDMGGFTRLCATKGGKPDGLEIEIPSLFTPQVRPRHGLHLPRRHGLHLPARH